MYQSEYSTTHRNRQSVVHQVHHYWVPFVVDKKKLRPIVAANKKLPETNKPRPQAVITTVTSSISLICCLIGLIWQLYAVSTDYFEYAVISEVTISKPRTFQPPAMSLCMRYTELINLDIDLPELGIPDSLSSTFNALKTIQEKVTVAKLMQITPSLDRYMTYGWTRDHGSYGIHEADQSSSIPSIINITKFLKDNKVCYRLSPIDQRSSEFRYETKHVAFGQNPGALMGVSMYKSMVSFENSKY